MNNFLLGRRRPGLPGKGRGQQQRDAIVHASRIPTSPSTDSYSTADYRLSEVVDCSPRWGQGEVWEGEGGRKEGMREEGGYEGGGRIMIMMVMMIKLLGGRFECLSESLRIALRRFLKASWGVWGASWKAQ